MVNVIAHKHVGVHPEVKSSLALFQEIQVALTISIVFEDGRPLVASTHDMIERSGEMYPRLSGHGVESLLRDDNNINKVCLTR